MGRPKPVAPAGQLSLVEAARWLKILPITLLCWTREIGMPHSLDRDGQPVFDGGKLLRWSQENAREVSHARRRRSDLQKVFAAMNGSAAEEAGG